MSKTDPGDYRDNTEDLREHYLKPTEELGGQKKKAFEFDVDDKVFFKVSPTEGI